VEGGEKKKKDDLCGYGNAEEGKKGNERHQHLKRIKGKNQCGSKSLSKRMREREKRGDQIWKRAVLGLITGKKGERGKRKREEKRPPSYYRRTPEEGVRDGQHSL